MNNPLVSIVLPTYNGEEYISRAIQSIINQTYTNWELIIVNDCSVDSTPEIINNFSKQDSRIKIINNDKNMKLPTSLNRGFEKASGEYYTWTSDDNEYYPKAFEKMVHFLDVNQDFGMVYARTNVEKNHEIQSYIWCERPTTPVTLLELCVPGACFMYRADIANQVGNYDDKCFLNEDHDYWLRILQISNIWNLKDVLYLYRQTSGSLTSTREQEIKQGKIQLLRKYRKIYAEKFLEIKDVYKDELLFDKYILGAIDWQDCKKNIRRKKLYNLLKSEYLYNNPNSEYIRNIMSLGCKYIFKGLRLCLLKRKIA